MYGLNSCYPTVIVFIFLISNAYGDVIQQKLEAQKLLARQKENQRIVAKLKLTSQQIHDLTAIFGSRDAGLSFARDVSAYTTRVRKDLLPSSLNFLWLFKQILYAYYRGFMIVWRVIPSPVKEEIVSFVTGSPMLMSLFKKLAPYLPGLAFDALSATLGLGGILG